MSRTTDLDSSLMSLEAVPCQHQKTSPTTSPTNQQQQQQQQQSNLRGSQRRHKPSGGPAIPARTSFEAYEERTVPALRQ